MNVRALRLAPLAAALALGACPPVAPLSPADASLAPPRTAVDAGWVLTDRHLTAWLTWQAWVNGLPALPRPDAGLSPTAVKARARLEQALATDAGLTQNDLEQIEDRVSLFVAERNVERLSGAAAVAQFKGALSALSVEQRVRAEAAFNEANARASPSSLPALEERFGSDTVRALLAREAELTRAWDSLLEPR